MNEKFIDDNVLKHVGSVISVGSLMYLERHKELLKDKNYNCAYKILRNTYIKNNFSYTKNIRVGELYEIEISSLLNQYNEEEDGTYEVFVNMLVDIIKRNNVADRFVDIFGEALF